VWCRPRIRARLVAPGDRTIGNTGDPAGPHSASSATELNRANPTVSNDTLRHAREVRRGLRDRPPARSSQLEVAANRFTIAGGPPNTRVSWQVTSIRKDPFAERNRLVPDEPKATADRGKYLHPELYGQSRTASLGHRADPVPSGA
jgi:hypothetical protein